MNNMAQSVFLECPSCGLTFPAEEYCDGECPDCGNGFEWDDSEENESGELEPLWGSNNFRKN